MIDGQQRLTTVSLLIEALARALGDERAGRWLLGRRSCATTTCSTRWRDGERHFKLLLSQTDKASLMAIVEQHASSPRSTRSG